MTDALVPRRVKIREIVRETPDIKTFRIEFIEGQAFDYLPGQCAMISVPAVGEAMFSITASPTRSPMEFSIKEVGSLTEVLHRSEPGDALGIRGPYGNGFPIERMEGNDLLFIGGGIGLAPLRSLINYCVDHRDDFGAIQIIYGARSPQDLVFKEELFSSWPEVSDVEVNITVDEGDEDWDGPVGFVPPFLEELGPEPSGKLAFTCGPPIMIRFVVQSLNEMGYTPDQVITTLEKKMKCGIGQCGRCNVGSKYVCQDGPVFSLAELDELPEEY